MGFADEGPSDYPIVQCDLADVLGAPGMPARAELARSLSTPRHRWSAMAGEDTLFLATSTVGASAFAPFEEQLAQPVGSERVQHTFRSGVCSQQTHQQTLGDRPVVGARFRTVSSPHGSVVLGGPVADLSRRDPGPAPRHSVAAVTRAVRDHLRVTDSAKISLEGVIFPHDGRGVWAHRAKVTDRSAALDLRAYVEGDKELSLLYAQDVGCAAGFGEGRVFRVNPGRHPAPEIVRLAGLEGPRGVLTTSKLKLVPAARQSPTPSATSGWSQMPVAYAQATLYDDPRFGDWVRNQPEGARRCDDPGLRLMATPTHSLSDRYAVGAAWAALLWDFRSRVGPGIAGLRFGRRGNHDHRDLGQESRSHRAGRRRQCR
jgi:hypothetical protein